MVMVKVLTREHSATSPNIKEPTEKAKQATGDSVFMNAKVKHLISMDLIKSFVLPLNLIRVTWPCFPVLVGLLLQQFKGDLCDVLPRFLHMVGLSTAGTDAEAQHVST